MTSIPPGVDEHDLAACRPERGSSAKVSATAPVTLTSNVFRHCCGLDSANRPG